MAIKVSKFIWDHISIGKEIESSLAKLLLHFRDVYCKFVLAGNFLVYLLMLIQSFVEVCLT